MASPLQVANDAIQLIDAGAAQRKQSRLAQLASQGYTATPDQRVSLLQQLASGDPQLAQTTQKSWDDFEQHQQQALVDSAKLYAGLPADQQQSYYNSTIAPGLRQRGLNVPDWSPEVSDNILKTANAYAQAYGPQTGTTADMRNFAALTNGLTPDQVAQAQRVRLGLEPRATNPSPRLYTDANGNVMWLSPPGTQQPAQPTPLQSGTDANGNPYRIDPTLSPNDYALAQRDIANGGAADSYDLLPRDVSPQKFGGVVPVPGVKGKQTGQSSALQDRIALARQMGASDDEIRRMVLGPNSSSGNSNSDDPLADLDPSTAALVKKIANYEALPSSLGRAANRADLLGRAAMLNPNYNEASAQEAYTFKKSLAQSTPTSAGGQVTAINTALHHLGTMLKANKALNDAGIDSRYPLMNRVSAAVSHGTGASAVNNWNQAKTFLSEEFAKLLKGGVASEGEIKGLESNLDASLSPKQRNDALAQAAEFLYGRISAIQSHQQDVLGDMATPLLTSESRQILGSVRKLNPNADVGASQENQQRQRGNPAPGTVDGGYRFKGGNPSDPNSWEKL